MLKELENGKSTKILVLIYTLCSSNYTLSIFGIYSLSLFLFSTLLFFLRFYLFIWQRESTQAGGAEGRGRGSREPDAGPDPRTPGPRPEPKADAQRPSHPGAPSLLSLIRTLGIGFRAQMDNPWSYLGILNYICNPPPFFFL